mmetsp:Transcript_19529/g.45930  ORF Transcript_19529/g.45930 Transcript_19529/m.45930 type:complete len:242 (+) Transcript_19529:673-1398(+)
MAAAAATAAPGATSFFGVRMHSQAPVAGRTPRAAVEAQKAEVLKVTGAIFEDAIAQHRKGDAHGALALFEQALFNYRRYLKPGDPLIVKTLNNIAATYDRIGNGAAAAAAYEIARTELEAGSASFNPFTRYQNDAMRKHLSQRSAAVAQSAGARPGNAAAALAAAASGPLPPPLPPARRRPSAPAGGGCPRGAARPSRSARVGETGAERVLFTESERPLRTKRRGTVDIELEDAGSRWTGG